MQVGDVIGPKCTIPKVAQVGLCHKRQVRLCPADVIKGTRINFFSLLVLAVNPSKYLIDGGIPGFPLPVEILPSWGSIYF